MLTRIPPDDPAQDRRPTRREIEQYREEERMEIEKLSEPEDDPSPHCGLRVEIANGEISIHLPIGVLHMAAQWCPELNEYDPEGGDYKKPIVTDARLFAEAVVAALVDEAENGSTLVTRMFDRAFCAAVDNGADGIHLPGDEDA